MKRFLALMLTFVMVFSITVPALSVSAADGGRYVYEVVAKDDQLTQKDYGNTSSTGYTGVVDKGEGWDGKWLTPVKLDGSGMFITRPTAKATSSRVKRTIANPVDFSVDGTYTFTATLKTCEPQEFVFELGDTGIEFGIQLPDASKHFYPHIKLPGDENKEVYSGEVNDNMKTYPMNVILEVTTNSDGDDTLKVGLCKTSSTSVQWLITKTGEISDKKVSFVNLGFNYYPVPARADGNGVSRIAGVKIEASTVVPTVYVPEEGYYLVAEDTLDYKSYGFSDQTFYDASNPFNDGDGWYDAWSVTTPSATKLDHLGIFMGRPGNGSPVRIERNIEKIIDFDVKGIYTFTAELRPDAVETQDFRFELGSSGVVFGGVLKDATDKSFYPQLILPDGSSVIYDGEMSDSMKMTGSAASMMVVLEVTTAVDGDDTLKVKAYRAGATEPDWQIVKTAELAEKTVSFVKTGFDYYPDFTGDTTASGNNKANGVSRIRSVKIERNDVPELIPDEGYYLVAEDLMTPAQYEVASDDSYTSAENKMRGTGWKDVWDITNAASGTKFDGSGMFIGRPSSDKSVKITRTLNKTVDFGVEGKYTFTAELRDSTIQTQKFVFELGDTGISFGGIIPATSGEFLPQIQLPNYSLLTYNGDTNTSMTMVTSTSMFVTFEVITSNDGADTVRIGSKSGSAPTTWLMTKSFELSSYKMNSVSLGYAYGTGYTKPDGVSRIRSVKIERDDVPVAEAPESYAYIKAYDDFESYADASDTEKYPNNATNAVVKLADIAPVNGGYGWAGVWTDGATDQISGSHSLNLYYDNATGKFKRELDLYTSVLNKYPLSRKFAKAIDFSKAGEYYIDILYQPSVGTTSPAFANHNFTFSIGDKLSFGTKYVDGKSVSGTAPNYYAHVTAGTNTVVGDEPYRTATYHNMFVKIVADGKGNATISLTIDGKGTISASASGLTVADSIKITDGSATSRTSYIDVEGYLKEQLDPIREAIKLYSEGKGTKSNVLNKISVLDEIGKKILTEELSKETGFSFVNVYEDFESYADPNDLSLFADINSAVSVQNYAPLNGGTGWASAWTDNDEGTITGGHNFGLKSHHFVGTVGSVKIYREIDLRSQTLGTYPLKRSFMGKMDFTEAGEYYLKLSARPFIYPTSSNMLKHNLTYHLGDDISFGTKYVEGKTEQNMANAYFYPHLTVNGETVVGETGVYTGQNYDYVVKIVADGNGNADVTYTLDSDKVLTAKATNLTSADYFGISDTQSAGSQLSYVQIEGYPKSMIDSINSAIEAYENGTGAREDAELLINGLDEMAQAEYLAKLRKIDGKLIITDDFESYADATDSSYFTAWSKTVSLSSISPINGGLGWDGAWTVNGSSAITAHSLIRTNENATIGLEKKLDLYVNDHATKPLSRQFAYPIDFSEKGEYFVKIVSQPSLAWTSTSFHLYDVMFSLGDKIHFGSGYDAERSDNSTEAGALYYPFLYVGDEQYESDSVIIPGMYYNYVVHLVSNGDGTGKVRFKVYRRNADAPQLFEKEIELSDMTTIENLTIGKRAERANGGTTRISDITIERYNGEDIEAARKAIDDLGLGNITYNEALEKVNKFSGIANEQMMAELQYNLGYVEVVDGTFKSATGVPILDTSKLADSVKYSFKLYNNYKFTQDADVFMGVYYGDNLAGVKTVSVPVDAKSETQEYTIGFDKLPEGTKEDISVKVFVFSNDNLEPFTDRIDMYKADAAAVAPEEFGKAAEGKTIVAFMGDSITHLNPSYHKWIEYYYRIKYPEKDIKFINKGISGDSAGGNEARFYWDILNDPNTGKPTEACIMIGMNDVNRSLYANDENGNDKGTDASKQSAIDSCLKNIADIADLCEEEGVKLTLITPTLYDESAYTSAENMDGVNAALGKIAAGVIKLANERNLPYIDFYGYINQYNAKLRALDPFKTATLFNVSDRIHATPQGTFMAGYLFIAQQLGGASIASVDVDAASLTSVTESAAVSDISYADGTLSYTYAPESLPMYMTDEYKIVNDTYGVPVTDSINREIIKVSGLEAGDYKIMIGDAEIGTYSAEALSKGVNIATIETNPGYIQSKTVYDLVTAKHGKDNLLRSIAYVERYLVNKVDLTDVEACIAYLAANYGTSTDSRYVAYPANKRAQADAVAKIAEYEAQMVTTAKPGTYEVKIIKQ